MADLQTQFNKFHETIKIDFDDNTPLRDKRNVILKDLREGLKKQFPTNTPTFSDFNQGSYDLATGVEPLSGEDYDIDVGVIFNISKTAYDPVKVKEWVYNALNTGARTVEWKRPCVRVQYHKKGEILFHVDLAIYAKEISFGGSEKYYLAKGFPGSDEKNKLWEESAPHRLKELLKTKFNDNLDRDQFRRIIRYLKRWKDCNFSSTGKERPTGIALTACCYHLFIVQKDALRYNDLRALSVVVNGIINMFPLNNQIEVKLPVAPFNNLFERMTLNQRILMKQKLIALRDALNFASNEKSVSSACTTLRKVFGTDFPSE